jgi:hypothetical protein
VTSAINRYYDPATGEFISVDPDVGETGQPFAYANDDPVNGIDPDGLDCGFFSFACAAYDATAGAVRNTGSFIYHHPLQTTGLILGALSIATGVGALAGGVEIASIGVDLSATAAGTISAVAGGIGSAIDIPGCVSHDALSCLAVGFNGLGAALSGFGVLSNEGALGAFLGGFGINLGLTGFTLDAFEFLVSILDSGSTRVRLICSVR